MINWPAKDPQEVADYSWQPGLDAGDTIAAFTVTTTSGVTIDSTTHTDTLATAWLSGGTIGETARFTLTIMTTGGRTFEETASLPIVDSATLADFRIRYPSFAAVSDAAIGLWLAEGAAEVAGWPEAERTRASMLYVAHKLAEASGPQGVTSFKSGTFSASLTDSAASRTGFAATIYGREYLALARRHFGTPMLAWTPGHV